MDLKDLEIDLIPSPNDPVLGAHVGIRIRHKILNIAAESSSQNTQHGNKQNAMQLLKERFLEIEKAKVNDNPHPITSPFTEAQLLVGLNSSIVNSELLPLLTDKEWDNK
jgi:hypothetical protein